MYKDPTEWRNGFKMWKETGESPWEAGRRKELPKFGLGTEGDVYMGPKSKTYNKEAVKQILHELPLSPIDPVMATYLGLTAIGKLFSLGRFYIKNRLSKTAQLDYKQFRRNGYNPTVSRNLATDTYVNDVSKLADKMSRLLDFGL